MSLPYTTFFNEIDCRWKVIDRNGFAFGDGKTIEEAIQSALVTGITRDEIEVEE